MQENRLLLKVGAILPVGAAFERQAGLRRRAPLWMQRLALEWLFRLVLEPRRLWRRYLIGNPQFVARVLRQWLVQQRQNLGKRFLKSSNTGLSASSRREEPS